MIFKKTLAQKSYCIISFVAMSSNHHISGKTVKEVLEKVSDAVNRHGQSYIGIGQRGQLKALRGVTIVLEDPNNEQDRYPYWDRVSDEWYQDHFVREHVHPPEKLNGEIIFPYTYAWRSKYHDQGWGHVFAITQLLTNLNYSELPFTRQQDLNQLVQETYQNYHPDLIFAVLQWLGKKSLELFIAKPFLIEEILSKTRKDILVTCVDQILAAPSTQRAITPSLTYATIDQSGMMTAIPYYQNYQLLVVFNQKGNPIGLESFHLHRTIDVKGGMQLDISHDRDWGMYASEKTGLQLLRMTIYCSDAHLYLDEKGAEKNLSRKTNIQQWLMSVTDAYLPDEFNLKKWMQTPQFKTKAQRLLEQFNP